MSQKMEHKAGSNIVNELSRQLYPTYKETFREVISNSFDEGSNRVEVYISAKEIVFVDYGNGISDIKKFSIYGESVKNGKEFELIGEKGLGKLSLLQLTNKDVEFLTNNGKFGMKIFMNEKCFTYDIGGKDEYLKHQGTKIIIKNPLFVPTQLEIQSYISKVFGLWLRKGKKIYINKELVKPQKEVNITEMDICKNVTGNIIMDESGNGNLDIYIKHVYINTIAVDPQHLFSGWVNVNLTPTTSRNDVVRDEKFRVFMEDIKSYVSKFPEKEKKDISNEEKALVTEINKMTELFMKTNDLKIVGKKGRRVKKVEDMIEISVGNSKMLVKQPETTEDDNEEDIKQMEEIEKTKKLNDKPVRHLNKNDYGVLIVTQSYGDKEPPIFFLPNNMIILNVDNSLYKFATKAKQSLGPKYLRTLWFFSSALVDLAYFITKKDTTSMSNEEFKRMRDAEVNKTIAYFLEQKGEL